MSEHDLDSTGSAGRPFEPMMIETASGDGLIIFTPGEGVESRDKCDVIVNGFGLYSYRPCECPHEGWVGASVTVHQHDGRAALTFTGYFPKELECYLGEPVAFTHFALSFRGGKVYIAAAKLRSVGWWYPNMESESEG